MPHNFEHQFPSLIVVFLGLVSFCMGATVFSGIALGREIMPLASPLFMVHRIARWALLLFFVPLVLIIEMFVRTRSAPYHLWGLFVLHLCAVGIFVVLFARTWLYLNGYRAPRVHAKAAYQTVVAFFVMVVLGLVLLFSNFFSHLLPDTPP